MSRHQNKALQEDYRMENSTCEWAMQFPGIETYIGRPVDMRKIMKPELNHIFTNPRRDHWANFCTLAKYAHDWFHAHIQAGRVLCMLVKFRKGEADVDFWCLASGKRIPRWVSGMDYPPGDWMRPYWQELVRFMKGAR